MVDAGIASVELPRGSLLRTALRSPSFLAGAVITASAYRVIYETRPVGEARGGVRRGFSQEMAALGVAASPQLLRCVAGGAQEFVYQFALEPCEGLLERRHIRKIRRHTEPRVALKARNQPGCVLGSIRLYAGVGGDFARGRNRQDAGSFRER